LQQILSHSANFFLKPSDTIIYITIGRSAVTFSTETKDLGKLSLLLAVGLSAHNQ